MADPYDVPEVTTECFCDNPDGNTREISIDSVAVGPQLPVDMPEPKGSGPFFYD